ncbi:MAG: hypothetical protein PUF49_05130 [Firmicutes bacterium]|nr:hypothetical protein [Bacillota bacterium]
MNKAHRGYIYQFLEKDGTTNKNCLVVSSKNRETNKIISILMIGTRDGFNSVCIGDGEYVHCDLVSFCDRKRLGKPICMINDSVLKEIDKGIFKALGGEDERE